MGRGRMTKMDLPILTAEEMKSKSVWDQWISVPTLSLLTGFTTAAIYRWIRLKRIDGRIFHGAVMVKRNCLSHGGANAGPSHRVSFQSGHQLQDEIPADNL